MATPFIRLAFTDPTEFVVAVQACHVVAASHLLYSHVTLRTIVYILVLLAPRHVGLVRGLVTGLPRVPNLSTFVAHFSVARWTSEFLDLGVGGH